MSDLRGFARATLPMASLILIQLSVRAIALPRLELRMSPEESPLAGGGLCR